MCVRERASVRERAGVRESDVTCPRERVLESVYARACVYEEESVCMQESVCEIAYVRECLCESSSAARESITVLFCGVNLRKDLMRKITELLTDNPHPLSHDTI